MTKLHRIRSPRRRLIFSLSLSCLLFLNIFTSSRVRVHWIGRAKRPRRPERLMIAILFLAAMFILQPREYVLWSMTWGGATSLFLILATVYRFVPRSRVHWVK